MKSTPHVDRATYEQKFEHARELQYPEIDQFERLAGYAVDRERLESAARVLQCPIKVNPPNWQHGRVLYTLARQYIDWAKVPTIFLDIGTAKGFSACVLSWAIRDADVCDHQIVSIDIIEPDAFVARNSIVECDKLQTVQQFVAPFVAHDVRIEFLGGGSAKWLRQAAAAKLHVGFAFIDGKHTFDAVSLEAITIAKLQRTGDVMLFDDTQMPEVQRATMQLRDYRREGLHLNASPRRSYCVAVRC